MPIILPMNAEHITSVAKIEAACFNEPWSELSLFEQLQNPHANFFVLEYNKKIVAYGGMHCVVGETYVTNIAVLPEFRKQGFGRLLTSQLIKTASDLKQDFISLEVRSRNLAAISLYKSLGFISVGLRPNFYDNPKDDGMIMTLYFH